MDKIEITESFAKMWRTSRMNAGKSQSFMANALGVSKKTIQNWEEGSSCPSQEMGFEWFQALGIQPLPYYLELLYPSFSAIKQSDDDDKINEAIIEFITSLPVDTKKKILYIASGNHGSSPIAILEMIVAHLNTPLRDRLNIAQNIITNYSLANCLGTISNDIQPDIKLLDTAQQYAMKAIIRKEKEYSTIFKDKK